MITANKKNAEELKNTTAASLQNNCRLTADHHMNQQPTTAADSDQKQQTAANGSQQSASHRPTTKHTSANHGLTNLGHNPKTHTHVTN